MPSLASINSNIKTGSKSLASALDTADTVKNVAGSIASGAAMGSVVPGVGTIAGGIAGGAVAGVDALTGWVSDIDAPSKATLRKMKADVELVANNAISAIDRKFSGSHSLRVCFGETLKDGKKTFDEWAKSVFAFPVKYEEGLLSVFEKFGIPTNGRIDKGDTVTLIMYKDAETLRRALEFAEYMYQNDAKNKAVWFAVKMSIEKNIPSVKTKKASSNSSATSNIINTPIKIEPVKIEPVKIELKIPFWKKPIFWGVVAGTVIIGVSFGIFRKKKNKKRR